MHLTVFTSQTQILLAWPGVGIWSCQSIFVNEMAGCGNEMQLQSYIDGFYVHNCDRIICFFFISMAGVWAFGLVNTQNSSSLYHLHLT